MVHNPEKTIAKTSTAKNYSQDSAGNQAPSFTSNQPVKAVKPLYTVKKVTEKGKSILVRKRIIKGDGSFSYKYYRVCVSVGVYIITPPGEVYQWQAPLRLLNEKYKPLPPTKAGDDGLYIRR